MLNKVNRLFAFPLGMVLLLGCCWAANAATPQVAAGMNHSIGLSADGKVYGWGNNKSGQLGLGRITTAPQAVPGLNLGQNSGKSRIAAGELHTVTVKSDGTVWAWGSNAVGQLGDGTDMDRSSPVQVPGLTGVVAVAAGGAHSLALKSDGSVWAWGNNDYGQLGNGTVTGSSSPVQVPGLSDVATVVAGPGQSLAVKSDGTVWVWGENGYGQLGKGGWQILSPVQVPKLTGVVTVAVGEWHFLALKSDGSVWKNDITENGSPAQVQGLTDVVAVAAGTDCSFALKSDGSVWAWGNNLGGRLGDGTTTDRLSPVQVLTGAVAVSANVIYPFETDTSGMHTMALKSDGTVWAWGDNSLGQIGDGTTTDRLSPVQVQELTGVVAVAAGSGHSIALKPDGSVLAWGDNYYGQLGGEVAIHSYKMPVQIPALSDIAAVAAEEDYTLALKSDGSVWAWGLNWEGQLGDGTTTARPSPGLVLSLPDVLAISAGAKHALAVKQDGTVWAWGFNSSGELGDGTTSGRHTPAQVPGLTDVAAVSGGGQPYFIGGHSLALKRDGSVWAWGNNLAGQLGDGTTTNRYTPVQTSGLTGVVAISAGSSYSLALKSDGSVWAWGGNNYGQLGDGTTVDRTLPVQVPGLTSVVAIEAGKTSYAVKSDGTVWAWGDNLFGQLGDGTKTNRFSPVQVPGLTGVVSVAAGVGNSMSGMHSLALISDGSVVAMGNNSFAELGDGTLAERHSPVLVVNPGGDGFLNLLADTTEPNNQTIGAISFSPAALAAGGTATASATATSGLAVFFSTTTPAVCAVSGSTVTGIAAGTCTIAADQPGNASYNPAARVTQNITVGDPVRTATAAEFYHADINHYFMTASTEEAAFLDNNASWGWARTGKTFNIWLTQASAPSNASPVCRFFGVFSNGTVGSHFYTVDAAECDIVKGRLDWGWGYENDAFYAVGPAGGTCPGGTAPVYRAYNNGMGGAPNHRYMTSQAEVDTMVAQGWVSEGTAFCGAQ